MTAHRHDDADPSVVVGVGASAGGVEALTQLVGRLPADFAGAMLVVLHVPSTGTSVLPHILDRAGPLPAVEATEGTPLRRGVIYIAPPDRHLTVRNGRLRLRAGPRENGHRPSVDPTFSSISAYGPRAVGVILSGTRDDGTRGMLRIGSAGGTTLVQDPGEAMFDGMIRSAQQFADIDGVLPISDLAAEVVRLSKEAVDVSDDDNPGEPSGADRITATRYTCPDCGGVLWRHESGEAISLKCSVGHAYSPASFDGEQAREIESALWAAARLLGDRSSLLHEMADRADSQGHGRSAASFREQAGELAGAAATIQRLVVEGRLPLGTVTSDLEG